MDMSAIAPKWPRVKTLELYLEYFDLRKGSLVNQKILFVDNELEALNCYRQMLDSEFDIATAASGAEGLLSLLKHGPFAVVISDMQMTGMDGVQFLKRLRQVVIITGIHPESTRTENPA